MATQIINVIVNSKGAVTVAKELNAIGESARTTTTYLNGLRAILAAALTFSGASQIIEAVDNFTVLQNRLRQVASETETVASSWERLMTIANNSYSTIDNTVNLYFRVAQAYKAWGESAEDAYEFTDLFQKAAVLSGSSVQTTSQAVYQFSQALNKGKLDGDEFRSVLEGLPYVASLIQKELGVTRAELYELSKEGKISVDRIKDAFENAADAIRGDWQNITPTIGMALIVLQNNWTDFLGSIQTSTGIFSGFASLILVVANNFDILAIALSPIVVSLGFLAGRLGLGLIVLGFKDLAIAIRGIIPLIWSLNAALLANPYIAAAAAVAAIVAGIIYFRNEIGLTNEVLLSMWNTVTAAFSYMLNSLLPIGSAIVAIIKYFVDWTAVWNAIKKAAETTGKAFLSMYNSIEAALSDLVNYIGKALSLIFTELMQLGSNFFGLIGDIVKLINDQLVIAFEAILSPMKSFWNYVQPALKIFITLISDIVQGWKNIGAVIGQNLWPIVKQVFDGWILIIRKVIDFVNDLISALRYAISLMGQTGQAAGGGGGGGGAHYGARFNVGEGFATGGAFKVGGTGAGRDTTPVAFRAERGERVTVETKKQQRQSDSATSATSVNVPVSITNVLDPALVLAANESSRGQRSILNVIQANRNEVAAILGVI